MRKKKSSSILSKAESVKDIEQKVSACLYGRSGTGKTTLLGTFPKLLLLDIGERGTDSIANTEAKRIRIDSWEDLEEVYWELKDGDHGFETVGLDALHSLQILAIQYMKRKSGKKEEDQTSQRDFGQASGLMCEWIANFRDLVDEGLNVVFLVHDRVSEVDTEDDAEVIMPEVGPRLMPSVSGFLVGACNVVGNTFIKERITKSKVAGQPSKREIQYCLRVGPHSYYHSKIRVPKGYEVPEYIVDPTYDKLVSVIKGRSTPAKKTNRKPVRRK